MKKKIPEFRSEDEEFEFWSKADSTEYVDWPKAERVKLPNLRPTLRTISVRLPVAMVEDLKVLAHQRDVPYQSLLKMYLADRIEAERQKRRGA
jgi:predicted DNA binding CopG/RHH family protein